MSSSRLPHDELEMLIDAKILTELQVERCIAVAQAATFLR